MVRGSLKLIENRFDGAITDEYQAIKFDSGDSDAYEARAWARYGLNDVSGAAEDCKKTIELPNAKNPDLSNKDAAPAAGLLYFINGNYEKAIEKWNNTIKVTGLPPPYREFLQKWIEKAKTKLPETQIKIVVSNSPASNLR